MFRDLRSAVLCARRTHEDQSIRLLLRGWHRLVGTAAFGVLGPDGVSSPPKSFARKTIGLCSKITLVNCGSNGQHYRSIGRQFRQIKTGWQSCRIMMGMTEDSEITIWSETSGTRNARSYSGPEVREEFRRADAAGQRLAADPQSGIWLGLTNGNLARYRSGSIETFLLGPLEFSVRAIIAAFDGSY